MNALVPIVTYKPDLLGRQTVFLGHKQIGQVLPIEGRTYRAAAMLLLPDHPRQWPARSIEDAKAIVERQVEEWLEGAGLVSTQAQRRRA